MADLIRFIVEKDLLQIAFIFGLIAIFLAIIGKAKTILELSVFARVALLFVGLLLVGLSFTGFVVSRTPPLQQTAPTTNPPNPTLATQPTSVFRSTNQDIKNPPVSFFNRWVNADKDTNSITRIEIYPKNNEVGVKVFGRCHPTDCDWLGGVSKVLNSYDAELKIFQSTWIFDYADHVLDMNLTSDGKLRVSSKTHFKDNSGRVDFESVDYFVIETSATDLVPTASAISATPNGQSSLGSPLQLSPANDSKFDHYPRSTTLEWASVDGAVKYKLWVGFCQNEKVECRDSLFEVVGTTYTFDFVGAQPGRWQVAAVDSNGHDGSKSDWWYFTYSR